VLTVFTAALSFLMLSYVADIVLFHLVLCSDHIVAQQANRYIVAFHIAISYNTQRPGYNGRAVGLRAPCMVLLPWRTVVLYALTSALQHLTAACETH